MTFMRQLIAPVLAAVLATGGAQAALYQWSKTAATNATADATINWSEGMSPGSVNDSARAMMARLAEWRDDFSGLLTTGGTSTAFTLTTNQGFTNPPTDGQLVAFTPHATNGASATLAADGGTARAIQTSPGVAVTAGTLVSGTPYSAKYSNSSGAWILRGYYGSTTNVPIGAVIDYTGSTAPNSNFIFASGQCISTTTYAAYYAVAGDAWSPVAGCSAGQFGVPDLRGRATYGLDGQGGTAVTGRITVAAGNWNGALLGAGGGLQTHTLTEAQTPAITPAGSISPSSYTPAGSVTGSPSVSDTRTWATSGRVVQVNGGGPFASTSGGFAWNDLTAASVTVATGSLSVGIGSLGFSGNNQSFTFSGTQHGSGQAHPIMNPGLVMSKIIRVL